MIIINVIYILINEFYKKIMNNQEMLIKILSEFLQLICAHLNTISFPCSVLNASLIASGYSGSLITS